MDGVTILSEHVYRGKSLGFVILAAIVFIFLFCAMVYGAYKDYQNFPRSCKKPGVIILDVCMAIVLMGIMTLFIGVMYHDYTTIYTDYKVQIDDSVSLNEFINNYEILSYDDGVYTVREIEG